MSSQPVAPRHYLYAFVTLKHHQQKRKYTNEPYFNHVKAVAEMADGKCKFGYEIGLCHDLLEDTDCTYNELLTALMRFGYEHTDSIFICNRVQDLTDVYTHEDYPLMNRVARKAAEAIRLHSVHPVSQTVKYCDLIHNTSSIVEYDKGFAKVYLAEKRVIMAGMYMGNKILYKKCMKSLEDNASLI